MIAPSRYLLALLILFLSASSLADDWFTNDDSITDLAHMAPRGSALFVGVDLSETFTSTQIGKLLESTVRRIGGPGAMAKVERELGNPVEQFSKIFGTRAFLAIRPPQGGPPVLVLGLETRDGSQAATLLKTAGVIPSRKVDRTVEVAGSNFQFIGKGGYGTYEDYLLISNSPEALKQTLEEGESLHDEALFQHYIAKVAVTQGVLAYGEIPDELASRMPEVKAVSHLLAGLGIQRGLFTTQAYALLNKEAGLSKALLSEAGTLKGEAARTIPNDWGFMASFDLRYLDNVLSRLEQERPDIAGEIKREISGVEKMTGVTIKQLLEVIDGEVTISSNGLSLLPKAFMGMSGHDALDYRLTVTMPVKDGLATRLLMKNAWDRLDLKAERLYDDIVEVKGAEVCYIVHDDQLIMSYGSSALVTLRQCLALRFAESLASRANLTSHYPIKNGIAAGYLDLKPALESFGPLPGRSKIEELLGPNPSLDGITSLKVQRNGLKAEGTGGVTMLLGTGVGLGAYIFNRQYNSAGHRPEATVDDE